MVKEKANPKKEIAKANQAEKRSQIAAEYLTMGNLPLNQWLSEEKANEAGLCYQKFCPFLLEYTKEHKSEEVHWKNPFRFRFMDGKARVSRRKTREKKEEFQCTIYEPYFDEWLYSKVELSFQSYVKKTYAEVLRKHNNCNLYKERTLCRTLIIDYLRQKIKTTNAEERREWNKSFLSIKRVAAFLDDNELQVGGAITCFTQPGSEEVEDENPMACYDHLLEMAAQHGPAMGDAVDSEAASESGETSASEAASDYATEDIDGSQAAQPAPGMGDTVNELQVGGAVTSFTQPGSEEDEDENPMACYDHLLEMAAQHGPAMGDAVDSEAASESDISDSATEDMEESQTAQSEPEMGDNVVSEAVSESGDSWKHDFIATIDVQSPVNDLQSPSKKVNEVMDLQSPVIDLQSPVIDLQSPVTNVNLPLVPSTDVVVMPKRSIEILQQLSPIERGRYVNFSNCIKKFPNKRISACTDLLASNNIVYKGKRDITVKDMISLSEENELNDVIVNGFLQMVQKLNEVTNADKRKYITNTQGTVTKQVPIHGRPRGSKFDPFLFDFHNGILYVTAHIQRNHWMFFEVNMHFKRIKAYDSMMGRRNERQRKAFLRKHGECIVDWLVQYAEKHKLVFVVKEGEWECEAADNVPQQDDITSCGVLMIVILLKVYFNENYRTVTVSPYQVITYRMQILKFLCEGITGLESAFWDDDPAKARAIDMFDRNWLEEKSRSYQQFKHDLNLINTNKHEFLVEFGPKPKRRTITLVVNEQEYSFQQEDLGMTFYQDSKLTQTQLTALLAKRSETSYAEVNRCFWCCIGKACGVHPFVVETVFRKLVSDHLKYLKAHPENDANNGPEMYILSSMLHPNEYVDIHSLLYFLPRQLVEYRIVVIQQHLVNETETDVFAFPLQVDPSMIKGELCILLYSDHFTLLHPKFERQQGLTHFVSATKLDKKNYSVKDLLPTIRTVSVVDFDDMLSSW